MIPTHASLPVAEVDRIVRGAIQFDEWMRDCQHEWSVDGGLRGCRKCPKLEFVK